MLTWDERKRQANIAKHGIDFADCEPVFSSPLVTQEDNRADYGEQRLQSLGLLNDVVVFLCWVERQQGPHLISIRKAKKHERATYFKSIGY
jgi:uncharacterized protein